MTFRFGRRRLQLCKENRLAQRPEILMRLRASGYDVEVDQCLDECPRCERRCIALVCGKLVVASSPEEFMLQLRGYEMPSHLQKDSDMSAGKG